MQAPVSPHSNSCQSTHVVSKIAPNTIGPGTNAKIVKDICETKIMKDANILLLFFFFGFIIV